MIKRLLASAHADRTDAAAIEDDALLAESAKHSGQERAVTDKLSCQAAACARGC